jgi:hypothetical protein
MPYLGIVAGASLFSNGAFRKVDLLESTVSSSVTGLLEDVLEELIKAELLVETTVKDTRLYRFSEDGIAPYLWLLSREAALRDAAAQQPPATPRLKFSQEKI